MPASLELKLLPTSRFATLSPPSLLSSSTSRAEQHRCDQSRDWVPLKWMAAQVICLSLVLQQSCINKYLFYIVYIYTYLPNIYPASYRCINKMQNHKLWLKTVCFCLFWQNIFYSLLHGLSYFWKSSKFEIFAWSLLNLWGRQTFNPQIFLGYLILLVAIKDFRFNLFKIWYFVIHLNTNVNKLSILLDGKWKSTFPNY